MNYQDSLTYIGTLPPKGYRLGLERMREFCKVADLQAGLGGNGARPQYIHVAGTNGKGSTTSYLQSLLVEANLATGAFFSPYVVDPRERIQLGRELIGEQEFARLATLLRAKAERFESPDGGGITEFEFKTAMGLLAWKDRCDWVALEVGLGGRFDATNVVLPRCSIVVSIGMDHMAILGGTLEKIAFEKAGIIKPGVPIVVGEMEEGPRRVIEEVARINHSRVWLYGRDILWEEGRLCTPGRTLEDVRTGLVGERQGHNLALAVASLEAAGVPLSEEQVRRGAERAYLPGRFELKRLGDRVIVLDGAHNADSAQVLRATLDREFPGARFGLVTNMLQGHELAPFYSPLREVTAHAYVVPIDFPRARSVGDTHFLLSELCPQVTRHESVSEGLSAALAIHPMVLVTGSFYLVGEASRAITGWETTPDAAPSRW